MCRYFVVLLWQCDPDIAMVTQCNSAEVFTLNFSPHNIWWRDTSQTKYLAPVVSSQITNNITSPSWKENDGININVVLLLARWKLKWSSRPELLKSTIEHGNGSNSHHGHFICLKLCRCRRRQTTEISDDTDCGLQARDVQTPAVSTAARWHPGYCTLSPPPQICTVWQKYNHNHLPTICVWCAMEQSQFANIFSVLVTFVFLSVVNIGAVWVWWPAWCCQLSSVHTL